MDECENLFWRKLLNYFLNKLNIRNETFIIYIVRIILNLASHCLAQRAPSISSPEVHADNTVTFRYYSRTAQKVSVSGEFLTAPQQLTKDTSGVWSVTVAQSNQIFILTVFG